MIKTIAKGTVFVITTGEHSDYMVHGVFKACKNITSEDYKKFGPLEGYNTDINIVIARMINEGFIVCVSSIELSLGEYNNLSPKLHTTDEGFKTQSLRGTSPYFQHYDDSGILHYGVDRIKED